MCYHRQRTSLDHIQSCICIGTSDQEKDIDTTHRKCISVVLVMLLLHSYLETSRFMSRTDYRGLTWILNFSDVSD